MSTVKKPVTALLHGLNGFSQSKYIAGLHMALAEKGIPSVAMNFRDCGGEVAFESGSVKRQCSRHLVRTKEGAYY